MSINYRLGLGGFLAGAKIAEELKRDGFAGNGNFGFTDQKVALEWVQRYIENFGETPKMSRLWGSQLEVSVSATIWLRIIR